MAAVQGLLKKHDAFETDFAVHRDRSADICNAGAKLTEAKNHHSESIAQRCQQLQVNLAFYNFLSFHYDYIFLNTGLLSFLKFYYSSSRTDFSRMDHQILDFMY